MKDNLNNKLIRNFIFLIFIFVLIICFFQIFLLKNSYIVFRKNDIKKAFNQIKDVNNQSKIESIASTYDSHIYIYNKEKKLVFESANLLPRGIEKEIISVITTSNFESIDRDIKISRLDYNYNFYGKDKGDYFILLISRLDPIESSISIISRQLIYVTIISVFFSIIIAIRLAKRLSNPIKNINDRAKELGKGNFDINFSENEYLELKELSITLNETTKKLKEKDKLQKEIVSNVSHDLKTPLTVIKGYAEVIRDVKDKKINRDQKLNKMIDEVDNLNSMINNILETSKLEANMYLNKSMVDISLIVKKVIKRLEKIIEDKGIVMDISTQELYADVDKDKIEQVIYNLIINAINHVGKDSTIIIKIDKNILEITDHGEGIKDKSQIFNKFYTTHNNKTANGLGLYIVKSILEKHNIEYGVESKIKEYTKFWIKF